jgi:hypothetical protein
MIFTATPPGIEAMLENGILGLPVMPGEISGIPTPTGGTKEPAKCVDF